MSIITNNIGNYSPYGILKTGRVVKSAANNIIENKEISIDEKNFFKKLYPENKTEVVDYHFYKPTGKMDGVSLGSLIDKRG